MQKLDTRLLSPRGEWFSGRKNECTPFCLKFPVLIWLSVNGVRPVTSGDEESVVRAAHRSCSLLLKDNEY